MILEKLRKQVMELGHNAIFSGHLGRQATQQKILSNFFWPKIHSEVARWLKSCDICQRNVPHGKVGKLPLGKVPLIGIWIPLCSTIVLALMQVHIFSRLNFIWT